MCGQCKNKREYEYDIEVESMVKLWNLKKAGYQFTPDDLTIDQWFQFNEIESLIIETANAK